MQVAALFDGVLVARRLPCLGRLGKKRRCRLEDEGRLRRGRLGKRKNKRNYRRHPIILRIKTTQVKESHSGNFDTWSYLIQWPIRDVVGRRPRRGPSVWGAPQETLRIYRGPRMLLHVSRIIAQCQSLQASLRKAFRVLQNFICKYN